MISAFLRLERGYVKYFVPRADRDIGWDHQRLGGSGEMETFALLLMYRYVFGRENEAAVVFA